jgi:hypothetical protein
LLCLTQLIVIHIPMQPGKHRLDALIVLGQQTALLRDQTLMYDPKGQAKSCDCQHDLRDQRHKSRLWH